MAISRVKLPDNSVQDIHDSRLPSVYPRIYVGTCPTAAATAEKVVTTEEFPLVNGSPVVGTTIAVKFTATNTGASPTLNVNDTGAHSIYYNNAVYTSSDNIAGYANRYSYYVWDGTNWVWLTHGTDNNDNTLAYNVRYNAGTKVVTDYTARYRILFSSADDSKWVPANTGTSTDATSSRAVNQTKINPFGQIVYYASTTILETGGTAGATVLYTQYNLTFGYSFNRTGAALTLTAKAPIYIKCAPQTDGSVIMDADTPYVQALPSTADGKVYIYLGNASSATAVELSIVHPVYYFADGQIRLWTNGASADVSGKQDKWSNVSIADNATTLAPTESGGALILADDEQTVGIGYMHNDENEELASAHMISAAPDGVKIQSLDDYGYKSIDFNGNGVDMNNTPIAGLPTPTDSDEAATKGYVDSAIPTSLSQLSDDSTHRVVTDAEKATWNGKVDIFIAQYGVTSFTDVSSAYNEGKQLIVVNEDYIYTLEQAYDDGFYFTSVNGDEKNVKYCSVADNGPWLSGNYDIPTSLADLSTDATHRTVTDTEKTAWNAKADIFVAEYNVTTIAQIIAAYNAGKIVLLKIGGSSSLTYVEYMPLYGIYEMYEGSEDTYADFYTPLREDFYFTRYSVGSNGWSNEEWFVANEDEIFVATYGSTSFSSILNAFNSGKQIIVKDNSNNTVYHLASRLYSTVFLFFSVGEESDILLAECTQNEGWSKSEYTIPSRLSSLADDSTHRLVTDAEKSTWNAKYTKPSTGIPASDLASGVIPAPEVFWATYGTTTASEIDDAVSAGKIVMCAYNNRHYILTYSNGESGTIVFESISGLTTYRLQLTRSNNSWTADSLGFETPGNKATSWGATPNNTRYPSEKLVYDTLQDYALATGDNSYDFAANSIRLVYEPQPGTTVNVPLTFALGRLHVSIPSGGALNTNKNVAFTDDIPSVPVQDVTVGGTSVVSNGTAVIPAIPSVPVTDVTVGGTSVVLSGTAVIPAIPTVPTISTNVVTDKNDDTKTSSPKSVYDEIHPATQSSQPAGGFLPNVVYNLGTLSGDTTFALATPSDSSVANHYYWTFDTGSTAPTITWPASITGWNGGSAPTINASKHYEISVLGGIGAFMEV